MKTISTELKDTLFGITGIIFAICAGIWTVFNYDAAERSTEIVALRAISENLSTINLKAEDADPILTFALFSS